MLTIGSRLAIASLATILWFGESRGDVLACVCSPPPMMWPRDGATAVATDARVLVWGAGESVQIESEGLPVAGTQSTHLDWNGFSYIEIESALTPNTEYSVFDGVVLLGTFSTGTTESSSIPVLGDVRISSLRESPLKDESTCASIVEEVELALDEQDILLHISRPDGNEMFIPSTGLNSLGEKQSEWCARSMKLDDVDGEYCLQISSVAENLSTSEPVKVCATVHHCLPVSSNADTPSSTCFETRDERHNRLSGGCSADSSTPSPAHILLILGVVWNRNRKRKKR
jgi:hypothetical protein